MNETEQKDKESNISASGRRSKFKPETVNRLLSAMADGLTIAQACRAAGIGQSTLADWKDRHRELVEQMNEAREQARQNALANIKAAGDAGDWRASEAFLRLSFAADYRRDGNINVTARAMASAQQAVTCPPEEQARLQVQLERYQEENAAAEEAEIERRVQARLAALDTKESTRHE